MAQGAIYPDLEGKVVIITGGGSGIGESIVQPFARQKAKVGFLDINARGLAEVGRATWPRPARPSHFEHCDLTDIAALRAAIGRIRARRSGPVDVLVNNAAHDERHRTEDVTPRYWDGRIAVNLKHQFFCAQAVLRGHEGGRARRHHQFRLDLLDGRPGRHGRLHGGQVGRARPHPLAGPRLRALQHPRQRHRAGLDHDAAPDRPVADARRARRS